MAQPLSDHALAELLAGLASRVNNMVANERGAPSHELLALQNDLMDLERIVVIRRLSARHAKYKAAVEALEDAIETVGDAQDEIDDVAVFIRRVKKAVALVEKAIAAAV